MEEGCKVIIVNKDSGFFRRKGILQRIKPTKEVVLLEVDLEGENVIFIEKEVREVKED
jgi:hypothetical protein